VTIVIDNCLPLSWVEFFRQHGQASHHWRELGVPNAPDSEIMEWANHNQAIVLTHDLDFSK
jgi:predicted nuclease of predicted toxin-antitoxin system